MTAEPQAEPSWQQPYQPAHGYGQAPAASPGPVPPAYGVEQATYTPPQGHPAPPQYLGNVPAGQPYGVPPAAHYAPSGPAAYQPYHPYGPGVYPAPTPAYMVGATTLKAPGVGPVIAFTALFGIFGAISASRRAKKAQAAGSPGRPYWMAFGITLAVVYALLAVMALAGPGSSSTGGDAVNTVVTADSLESAIVSQGDFRTADGTAVKAASAMCTPSSVDPAGVGTYRCMVDFTDNNRSSFVVTTGADGSWVTDSGTN